MIERKNICEECKSFCAVNPWMVDCHNKKLTDNQKQTYMTESVHQEETTCTEFKYKWVEG